MSCVPGCRIFSDGTVDQIECFSCLTGKQHDCSGVVWRTVFIDRGIYQLIVIDRCFFIFKGDSSASSWIFGKRTTFDSKFDGIIICRVAYGYRTACRTVVFVKVRIRTKDGNLFFFGSNRVGGIGLCSDSATEGSIPLRERTVICHQLSGCDVYSPSVRSVAPSETAIFQCYDGVIDLNGSSVTKSGWSAGIEIAILDGDISAFNTDCATTYYHGIYIFQGIGYRDVFNGQIFDVLQ